MTDFTTALRLALPDFDISPWHDDVNNNFTILDAAFRALTGLITQGVWDNSILYVVGQNVIDPQTGLIWTVVVGHTSSGAPTTFAQDRTAHPTFWVAFTSVAANKGQWLTATPYNINDFLFDGQRFGIVTQAYTSGASYNADVAAGKIVTLIDLSFYITIPSDGYTYGVDTGVWTRLNTAVPGADYSWDSTVGGTPATGTIRYNNAAAASTTNLLIHKTDGKAIVQTAFINMIAQPGIDIFLGSEKVEAAWNVFTVIGLPTDSGTFITVPVVFKQTGSSLTNGEYCRLSPLGGAGSKVTTDDTAPVGPLDGQLWYRTSNGKLYVFYDDGTSSQWVESSGDGNTTTGVNLAGYSTIITSAGTQSLGTGVFTKLTDMASSFDPSGFWNATTDNYQPTKAGMYLVSFRIGMIMEASKVLSGAVRKNGGDIFASGQAGAPATGGNLIIVGGSGLVQMNGSTDTLDFAVFHSNVVSTNINATTGVSVTYIGEAGLPAPPPAVPVQRGYIWGCQIANDPGDLTNDIRFDPGECASYNAPYTNMVTTAKQVKRLDAAWTAGDGNGGLDQGSIANASYHTHRIENPTNGLIDHIISLSHDESMPMTVTIASPAVVTTYVKAGTVTEEHGLVAGSPIKFSTNGVLPTGITGGTQYYVQSTGLTATTFRISTSNGGADVNTSGTQSGTHAAVAGPQMPSGYTLYRRVGSFTRTAAAIDLFRQDEDRFRRVSATLDRNSTAAQASILLTVGIPKGLHLFPWITATAQVNASSNAATLVGDYNAGAADTTILSTNSIATEATVETCFPPPLWVSNRSAQILFGVVINSGTITSNVMRTLGWIDTRGRLI